MIFRRPYDITQCLCFLNTKKMPQNTETNNENFNIWKSSKINLRSGCVLEYDFNARNYYYYLI